MIDDALTHEIIDAAFAVHNDLKPGLKEKCYVNALGVELHLRGMKFEIEAPIKVVYKGYNVGNFFADIMVENEVIIELKAVRNICVEHEVQLVNYLSATKKDRGLILNFGAKSLQIKRKTRLYKGDE